VVYKAVTNMPSRKHFEVWLEKAVEQDRHTAINVVGAPASGATQTGPSTKEASMIAAERLGVKFGAVCIAERHTEKKCEHVIMGKKSTWGAEWFISQGIYDPEPMVQLIKDYSRLCQDEAKVPDKIILTFCPCGRRSTLNFIRWLGMQVSQEVEDRIFASEKVEKDAAPVPIAYTAQNKMVILKAGSLTAKKPKKPRTPVEISCDLLCEFLTTVLMETAGCGVPLGINVESVSGFKDEIDATHDLFRSLQAILLDGTGSPWVIRWSRIDTMLGSRALKAASKERPTQKQDVPREVVQMSPLQVSALVAASALFGVMISKRI
jgi:hypothetical protein